ncbi:MAG TPA: hypothetical protein VI385_14275 [Flavisolibacter sp.]
MELRVFQNTTIDEVKERFSHYFPFLKLEFFIYHHHTEDSPQKKEIYKGNYLEETSEFFKEGTIYFSPGTTIAELEQEFQIELGLAARIYRRSIDTWHDTSQTAHLSLAKQNSMGGGMVRAKFNMHTLFL